MFEIKILKAFEHIEKKKEITNLMRSFSKKNKVSEKDAWVLNFEKREDFIKAIVVLANKISEFKTADILYDYCINQKMDNDTSRRFIESFFLYHSDFLSYAINITALNLDFYLNDNNVLNIESFLLFNMNALKKELDDKLTDPETINSIFNLMESSVLDKITILQTIAETQEILDQENVKIKPVKDFKIYCVGEEIKCITDKKVEIDRFFFDKEYGIFLDEEFDDLEVLVILIGLMVPERVILFNSIPEEDKDDIKELVSAFAPIAGDIKIFNADEMVPR